MAADLSITNIKNRCKIPWENFNIVCQYTTTSDALMRLTDFDFHEKMGWTKKNCKSLKYVFLQL